jgi:hypothetical protein
MKRLLLLYFILHSISVVAQTEATIRTHYTTTNQQILESIKDGYEGPLYQNQLVLNKNGKSWPAVGRYEETADFWYDDDPAHISPQERNPKNVLLKVNVKRHNLHMRTSEEYLYKDGKLLFHYSVTEEEGNSWEVRVYYNNKGLAFKTSVKENGKELTIKELASEGLKDYKPNPIQIMTDAKNYQSLFLKSM